MSPPRNRYDDDEPTCAEGAEQESGAGTTEASQKHGANPDADAADAVDDGNLTDETNPQGRETNQQEAPSWKGTTV